MRSGAVRGGYEAAQSALSCIDPVAYGRDRNHLDGHVTRLSAYLHHGVLTLAEVRDHALRLTTRSAAWKLVDELSWRDYYRRVWAELGWRVWTDLQPYKTGVTDYATDLPQDVATSTTGLACVDAWSAELRETGYLHNHVRMWFASYLVHHRRVRWQAGARFFLQHLIDGDVASNNLSWQWVASTWRRSPYLFNRGNLTKYAGQRWCEGCPVVEDGCPFATTYDRLSDRLFADPHLSSGPGELAADELKVVAASAAPVPIREPGGQVLVWVHGERLSPTNEALVAYPDAAATFVWDTELIQTSQVSDKRLRFIAECLAELPVAEREGDVVGELVAAAAEAGVSIVATTGSASPRFSRFLRELGDRGLEVQVWPEEPFVTPRRPLNLRSHSAYWKQAQTTAFG